MARLSLGSFSLEHPEGWSISTLILSGGAESDEKTAGMLTTKAVRQFQRNLIATMEPVEEKMTVDGYVKRQIEGLKQAGVVRQEAAPPEKVTMASKHEGLITEQVILGPGGERVRQMQLVVIKDRVAHTVIASHLDGLPFEKSRQEFRGMLLSFT